MTMNTATVRLAQIGNRLYGPEWASGIAALTGVSHRTVQRVRRAALDGTDDLRASGVLTALVAVLSDLEKVGRAAGLSE